MQLHQSKIERLNMRTILPIIIFTALTASCSKAEPDISDLKKDIKEIFSECPSISIDNIKELNSTKENDSKYIVNASILFNYTASKKSKDIQDNLNVAIEQAKKYDEEASKKSMKILDMERERDYNSFSNIEETEEHKNKATAINEENEILKELQKKLSNQLKEIDSLGMDLNNNFKIECPLNKITANLLVVQLFSSQDNSISTGSDIVKEVNTKLTMIKTENGWSLDDLIK